MKLKLLFFASLMAFVSYTPLMANDGNSTEPTPEEETMTREEYELALSELKAKVHALKEAKKLADTPAEKKALRAKIRDVKKEAKVLKSKALSGGVYLSTGAVILIILLIILL